MYSDPCRFRCSLSASCPQNNSSGDKLKVRLINVRSTLSRICHLSHCSDVPVQCSHSHRTEVPSEPVDMDSPQSLFFDRIVPISQEKLIRTCQLDSAVRMFPEHMTFRPSCLSPMSSIAWIAADIDFTTQKRWVSTVPITCSAASSFAS
jgi:hypothetical protein